MINQCCQYYEENNIINITLLDLCVGKGGDISKWYDNGIMEVIGFDIDENSIRESKTRFNQIVNELKKKNKPIPKYEFYVMDLSQKNNFEYISNILINKKFNIISCQFAIHYFFKNNDTLLALMNIVGKYISNNGFFIGTTMNGSKLKNLFTKNKIIENKIFKISYISKNTYDVSLGKITDKDHYFVNNVSIEYLVDIEILKKVSKSFNIMFLGITEFNEWYKKYNKNKLSNDEKEFSFLNFSFVFIKN